MMLTEETAVPAAALPVQALKDHLRLGTGFADDGLQDGLIESLSAGGDGGDRGADRQGADRAACSSGCWTDWRDPGEQALPVAPVSVGRGGDAGRCAGRRRGGRRRGYRLVPDLHRPRLAATGAALPTIPTDGQVEMRVRRGLRRGLGGRAGGPAAGGAAAGRRSTTSIGSDDGLREQAGCRSAWWR